MIVILFRSEAQRVDGGWRSLTSFKKSNIDDSVNLAVEATMMTAAVTSLASENH
jgi:hypothetical protein